MKEFTVSMALFDFVPVIFFIISLIIIGKDLDKRMDIINKVIYYIGFVMVAAAGTIKASYKLLYGAGIGDFEWMSKQFFTNQSIGFLVTGAALLFSLRKKKDNNSSENFIVIPTMALVGGSVVGLMSIYAALCRYAAKLGKTSAIVFFVISSLLSLSMGYLSTKDFSTAYMNWIAQAVNATSQISLFIGTMIIHKNGLKNQ